MSTWREHVKNTGKNMAGKPLSMVLKEASKTWKNIKKTVKATVPRKSIKRVKKIFRTKLSRKRGKKKNSRKRRKKNRGGGVMEALNSALGYSPDKDRTVDEDSPVDEETTSDKVFSSILDEMKNIVDTNKCKEMYDIKNVVVLCRENEDIFNGINSILNMQKSEELYNNIITLAKEKGKVKIKQLKQVTDIVKLESCNTSESTFTPAHAEKIKTEIDNIYPENKSQSTTPPLVESTTPAAEPVLPVTTDDETSADNKSPEADSDNNETPGILNTVTSKMESIGKNMTTLAEEGVDKATGFFTTSKPEEPSKPEETSEDKESATPSANTESKPDENSV